jgi:diaminopimelate decarboxylase
VKTRDALNHACLDEIVVDDDQMVFGGKTVAETIAALGKTPAYLYDRELMTARVDKLRRALPDPIHLHYAVKANPMRPVVDHLAGLVDGLDVASAGELEVVLKTSVPREHISFAGPGKTPVELKRAIEAGIVINMESERELERIAGLGESLGKTPLVAVRINPDFELKTSGMKMSGGPKPFGIDSERVPELLGRIGSLGLDFRGFHIFSGSQNLRHEAICDAQQQSVDLALELSAYVPSPIRQLNIGGGFGIPYFPGDRPLELAPIGENLEQLLSKVQRELPAANMVIELGRYLVGEAGIYVCKVIDRKISRGHVFLITDGGLHHHLAASGNFGQIIRKNYPVVAAGRVRGPDREVVSVVGPLCTPLDLLADKMEMGAADVDDLIVVFQSGAYGLTASPTAFLSHPPPAEILL